MDKYQNYIFNKLDKGVSFVFDCCCPVGDEESDKTSTYCEFDQKTDTLQIKQDNDITKTQYVLTIDFEDEEICPFSKVLINKNEKWEVVSLIDNCYTIIADFNDRIKEIKFVFANAIADDYVLNIEYIEADKGQYYARKEEERKQALIRKACVRVSVGADLVNVYFQPCCEEYDFTKIDFYVVCPTIKGGPVEWQIMTKRKTSDDFYVSLSGLAYGEYSFILKQYDKNGKMLIETDRVKFRIDKPIQPEFGQLNVI